MQLNLTDKFLIALAMAPILLSQNFQAKAQPTGQENISIQSSDNDPDISTRPADPDRGSILFSDPEKGNCIACHMIRRIEDVNEQGTIGTALDGIGAKYSEGQFRQLLQNPQTLFPKTMMPSYTSTESLYRVEKQYVGKPILSPDEIEDVIAFLLTLN